MSARPNAIGGEDPGERMEKNSLHPQRVGDKTGMLAGRTSETVEGVRGDIIAALDGDLLNGVRHVFHGNAQKNLRPPFPEIR